MDLPIVLGTQDGKDSGIWVTQWDGWDYRGMSQLFYETGWEGQWDLGHPVGWMRLSWDVPIVLGIREGQWDLGHPVGQVGLSQDVLIVLGTQNRKASGI